MAGERVVLGEVLLCRYKRQEEHPYLLALAKALRRKKECRDGEDRKGRKQGPLDPGLGKTKNTGM